MFAACTDTSQRWNVLYLLAGLAHPACGGSEDQMRAVLDEFATLEESMPSSWTTTVPSMRDIFDIAVARPPNDHHHHNAPEPHDPNKITYEALTGDEFVDTYPHHHHFDASNPESPSNTCSSSSSSSSMPSSPAASESPSPPHPPPGA